MRPDKTNPERTHTHNEWCSNSECSEPCMLLGDIRIRYILRQLNEQFPDKFYWRCEERQDVIDEPHEYASVNHVDGTIWIEFLYWSSSKDISLELCVLAGSNGDIEETVLWELKENESNSKIFCRIINNVLRRITAFLERGMVGFNEIEPPKYCLQMGDIIWRYSTAEEAWNNHHLDVRKYGSCGPQILEEFKARLDAGEELQYFAMVAYFEGAEIPTYQAGDTDNV